MQGLAKQKAMTLEYYYQAVRGAKDAKKAFDTMTEVINRASSPAKQGFTDEIVYMIECLRVQLRNQQVEATEKLSQFTIKETRLSNDYNQLKKEVHQVLAKVSLTVETVKKELALFGDAQLPHLLSQLVEKEGKLLELNMEFEIKTLPPSKVPLYHWKECEKSIDLMIDHTKILQMGNIPTNCRKLYKYCEDMMMEKTNLKKLQLLDYSDVLESTWSLYAKSACITEVSQLLEDIGILREQMLAGAIKPPPASSELDSLSSMSKSMLDYTSLLEDLRKENKELREKLASEMSNSVETRKKCSEALLRSSELSISEREMTETKTIRYDALEELNRQLKEFCAIGKQIATLNATKGEGMAASDKEEFHSSSNGVELLGNEQLKLLVKAQEISGAVNNKISFIKDGGLQATGNQENLVKIAYPSDYRAGDVVIMTPFNTLRGAVPTVLHLQWKKPLILMDFTCLEPLGIKPGKVPQLFFARLREVPRQYKLEDNLKMAKDIGESSGVFYRVSVDPVTMKFVEKDMTLLCADEQQKSVSVTRSQRESK